MELRQLNKLRAMEENSGNISQPSKQKEDTITKT